MNDLEQQAHRIIRETLAVHFAGEHVEDLERRHLDPVAVNLAAWADLISQRRAAEELAIHAQFYWDHASMLEPMKELADQAGEAGAALALEAQVKVMREVSARLSRAVARMTPPDPEHVKLLTPPSVEGK